MGEYYRLLWPGSYWSLNEGRLTTATSTPSTRRLAAFRLGQRSLPPLLLRRALLDLQAQQGQLPLRKFTEHSSMYMHFPNMLHFSGSRAQALPLPQPVRLRPVLPLHLPQAANLAVRRTAPRVPSTVGLPLLVSRAPTSRATLLWPVQLSLVPASSASDPSTPKPWRTFRASHGTCVIAPLFLFTQSPYTALHSW